MSPSERRSKTSLEIYRNQLFQSWNHHHHESILHCLSRRHTGVIDLMELKKVIAKEVWRLNEE